MISEWDWALKYAYLKGISILKPHQCFNRTLGIANKYQHDKITGIYTSNKNVKRYTYPPKDVGLVKDNGKHTIKSN